MKLTLYIAMLVLGLGCAMPPPGSAHEATANIQNKRLHETSTGYYEQYEVRPGLNRELLMRPEARKGVMSFGGAASKVRVRTRLDDAHRGLRFYERRSCVSCHVQQGKDNLHVVRNGLQCRQCHGAEPIAATEHYYSPLNRIRRHAYVCAKCHQGAGVSFASYVVHEPNPVMADTRTSFPALFYAFWIMAGIAGLTFLLFLPHTALWGIRELFRKPRDKEDGK